MPSRGLNEPLFYDFLLFLMTRGREARFRGHLLDLANVTAGEFLLDIGCGTGTTAIAAWDRVKPEGVVHGCDVSPRMLARARRKAPQVARDVSLHFTAADAVSLPFRDGLFDVALLTTVLHMLPENERGAALCEAARVLRPQGRLLIVDYGGVERKGLVAHHHMHQRFDITTMRPLLEAAGLKESASGPLNWLSLSYILAVKV